MSNKAYVTIDQVELYLEFDYEPGEEPVLYPAEDCDPGYPAEADITYAGITIDGDNLINILSDNVIELIEERCLDSMKELVF